MSLGFCLIFLSALSNHARGDVQQLEPINPILHLASWSIWMSNVESNGTQRRDTSSRPLIWPRVASPREGGSLPCDGGVDRRRRAWHQTRRAVRQRQHLSSGPFSDGPFSNGPFSDGPSSSPVLLASDSSSVPPWACRRKSPRNRPSSACCGFVSH